MRLSSIQSKINSRFKKRSNLGTVGFAFCSASSLEEKAFKGYLFEKYTDYFRAKAKGLAYRYKFPGKDKF